MNPKVACDICDRSFDQEEMRHLGGDAYFNGTNQAFPACCEQCARREEEFWARFCGVKE